MQSELFRELQTEDTLKAEMVPELMGQLMKSSQLFLDTGGVHTAAISDGEKLVYKADDIGRHNCIDKIIGWELMNNKLDGHRKVIAGQTTHEEVAWATVA